MKRRVHFLTLLSCLIVVLPSMAEPSYSQTLTSITESDVQALINAMDKAARKGNAAGILSHFAPDAKVKITLMNPGAGKEVVQTLDKEQYAFGLRQVLRRKISYQLVRKNVRIKIYDAETATVTSELYETFKFREGTVRSSSSDVVYVNLRNGKLVITGTEARARFY